MLKKIPKKIALILLLSLPSLLISQSLQAAPLISEFNPNPTGGDPANSTFELSGTPGQLFSGWIISIESDSTVSSLGTIDRAAQVSGTFDANGLLVVDVPDLENPSNTVVLLDSFTGATGIDIDTDNDGTPDDTSSFGLIYDALGVPDIATDESTLYGAALGGTDFSFTGDEPRLVFRENSTGNWYAINDPDNGEVYDTSATNVTPEIFTANPTVGTDTFGTVNPSLIRSTPTNIPVFGPFGLLTMILGLLWFSRRRNA